MLLQSTVVINQFVNHCSREGFSCEEVNLCSGNITLCPYTEHHWILFHCLLIGRCLGKM